MKCADGCKKTKLTTLIKLEQLWSILIFCRNSSTVAYKEGIKDTCPRWYLLGMFLVQILVPPLDYLDGDYSLLVLFYIADMFALRSGIDPDTRVCFVLG